MTLFGLDSGYNMLRMEFWVGDLSTSFFSRKKKKVPEMQSPLADSEKVVSLKGDICSYFSFGRVMGRAFSVSPMSSSAGGFPSLPIAETQACDLSRASKDIVLPQT